METQQRTVISYAINFEKVWPFILFYGQFWSLGNLQNLCKQLYLSILLVLNIAVFICTLFVQVATKNFPGGTLLAHFRRYSSDLGSYNIKISSRFWWNRPDMSKIPTIFEVCKEKIVAVCFVFYRLQNT